MKCKPFLVVTKNERRAWKFEGGDRKHRNDAIEKSRSGFLERKRGRVGCSAFCLNYRKGNNHIYIDPPPNFPKYCLTRNQHAHSATPTATSASHAHMPLRRLQSQGPIYASTHVHSTIPKTHGGYTQSRSTHTHTLASPGSHIPLIPT